MKKKIIHVIRKMMGTDKVLINQTKIIDSLLKDRKLLNEILNSQIFHSSIQNNEWLINKSFSPGNWAVDYAFLYTLYRILNEARPQKIVEFGLGQTTKLIDQYSNFYKKITFTFEHDNNWIDFFHHSYNLGAYSKIIYSELSEVDYKGSKTLRYKEDIANKVDGGDIELVILDGPFGSKYYSRIQILDLIPNSININNFCILIDDYQRLGEKQTAQEIFSTFSDHGIKYRSKVFNSSKDHILICSLNNTFLTSI